MQRCKGLMSEVHALIQHINPACRAARQFPHLPISRLLISLNDFDLPINHLENLGILGDPTLEYLIKLAAQMIMLFVVLTVILLMLLPTDIGEGIMDCVASVIIGVISAVFYFLAEIDTVLSVSMGAAILILFFTYEYYQHEKWVKSKWTVLVPIEEKEDGDEDLSKPLLADVKPKMKQMVTKNWKSTLMKKLNNNFGSYFAKFNPNGSPAKPGAAGGGGSPGKSPDLKAKLWPSMGENKLKKAVQATIVMSGSSNAKRLVRAATRAVVKDKLSKMEDTLAQQMALAEADLNSMHSDSPILSKDGVVVVPHAHADETPQERLARLNPNSKSSVLSRSALRALKKEEEEVAASNILLSGSGTKDGLNNNTSQFSVMAELGNDFNFD
jgi:hypothetical protein